MFLYLKLFVPYLKIITLQKSYMILKVWFNSVAKARVTESEILNVGTKIFC